MRDHGVYHAYYNALFDLPKLVFQTATITTYLSEGFPLPLIQLYLVMLLTSWLISFYRFQQPSGDPHHVVARLVLLFDLFFSVFAPVIVLVYASHQFNLDREAFMIRQETLSPGSDDRTARPFADPVTQVWSLITKTGLNALGVYKCKEVIVVLILEHAERATASLQPQKTEAMQKPSVPKRRTQPSRLPRAFRVQGMRRHLIFGILVFLVSIVAILTYVIVAITTSTHNCRGIPECRVISYRWKPGSSDRSCPCIVYISRNDAPRTYQEWINATDVTRSLATAAKSGHLKTVEIVNHAVCVLPNDLRHCHEMEQLMLVYTQTQSLPDCIAGFKGFHYMYVTSVRWAVERRVRADTDLARSQIESDVLHYPLQTLPRNLFSQMPGRRFNRFGVAAKLLEFPSLAGLHRLTTLVLSMPHGLTTLPPLDDLGMLGTLIIGDATHLTRLPSLHTLTSLRFFSLFRRNAMCCNGFLSGTCDLADFQCTPRADEPPVTCETTRLPREDRVRLDHIDAFVCSTNPTADAMDSEPTVASTDVACGGVLFKQCCLSGHDGICFNGRRQIVHCDIFGEYESMRRREIVRSVGSPCDPTIEAWLSGKH